MVGNDLDMMGLLSGLFGGGTNGGTIGAPMQILPQVQQDAMAPSIMDRLKGGLSSNAGDMLKFSGGLLNQKQQPLPMMQLPQRQPVAFGMGGPSMPTGGRLNPLLNRFR